MSRLIKEISLQQTRCQRRRGDDDDVAANTRRKDFVFVNSSEIKRRREAPLLIATIETKRLHQTFRGRCRRSLYWSCPCTWLGNAGTCPTACRTQCCIRPSMRTSLLGGNDLGKHAHARLDRLGDLGGGNTQAPGRRAQRAQQHCDGRNSRQGRNFPDWVLART